MDKLNTKDENTITKGNETLFMCSLCNDCYSQEKSLKLHFIAHRRDHTCDVCHQVFTRINDFNVHLLTHNKAEQKCTTATRGADCFSKNQVKERTEYHEAIRYVCKICNAELSYNKELEGHKISHKFDVCDGCMISFLKESELNGNDCADATVKEFQTFDDTTDHLEHSDVKHVCGICNEVFDNENLLNSHIENHENVETLHLEIYQQSRCVIPY